MVNDMEKNTEEPQDAQQGREHAQKLQIKRNSSPYPNSTTSDHRLVGMQIEMSKLVALLQDSLAPASKKRKPISDLEGSENQFLTNSISDTENEISALQNGNEFACNPPGDQFPILRDVEVLEGQMATSPMSLTSEMTDGKFNPQFSNSLAQLPPDKCPVG